MEKIEKSDWYDYLTAEIKGGVVGIDLSQWPANEFDKRAELFAKHDIKV